MDFSISDDHRDIHEGVSAVVRKFDDSYWLARDDDGQFPHEFHRAMAKAGWLGITLPAEYGGAGLGVTEASIMMHEVASHGGGMAAASTVHITCLGHTRLWCLAPQNNASAGCRIWCRARTNAALGSPSPTPA